MLISILVHIWLDHKKDNFSSPSEERKSSQQLYGDAIALWTLMINNGARVDTERQRFHNVHLNHLISFHLTPQRHVTNWLDAKKSQEGLSKCRNLLGNLFSNGICVYFQITLSLLPLRCWYSVNGNCVFWSAIWEDADGEKSEKVNVGEEKFQSRNLFGADKVVAGFDVYRLVDKKSISYR